ncbi:TonB-dependent receptor [Arenimonas sp. GDDSR-1]|uniref:TonB-dependent receptor plug domain-containing protein n=1 Tax=Arenimonas sp. GDDSR-1 TaxID=2950125 RepID=UPI0026285C4C|nr:TonB-dependent receptor [Arenimonas sp. GDDSR-1]
MFVGAASSAASVTAFAQEKDEAKTLDRVEVTGSRIKRADAETTQPVAVVTRADIEKSGLTNVFDILNNITSSDGSGLSTTTTQTNGSDGSQQISLRGLGANRTLVLVDGKRWVTDLDGVVDLSTIPVAIIERIDVLKDGASAVYGSDAIAGVVNIITRKNFEGAQIGLSYGQTQKGDGAQRSADITIGAAGERTSGVLSISYSEQEAIMAGDRLISREPYYGCFEYYGGYCPYGSSSSQYGRFYTTNNASGPSRTIRPTYDADGVINAADVVPFTNSARYNFSPINYLQQPAQRLNMFGAGRFQVTDNISAYARVNYTKRYSNQQLAEVPLTFALSGGAGPQWKFGIAPDTVFSPNGTAYNSGYFRMSALGPRNPSYDYDIFTIQTGLEGSFQVGDRYFSWDVMAARNDSQRDSRGTGYVNLFNMKNALGPGCTPFNIFGGPTLGLGTTPNGYGYGDLPARAINASDVAAMLNYVGYTQVSTAGNTLINYAGNLTGDLFELPAGMLSFAVGFEYRRDSGFDQPDTLVSSGGSSDNFSQPTKGETEVTEYFAEVTVPLLKDVFLAKELEIRAAVRKSDYSAHGFIGLTEYNPDPGSPTNAMYGLKWKPMDSLLIRASWGENFRAPSVNDLFAGKGEGFPQANDPCRTNVLGAQGSGWNTPANAAACTAAGLTGLSGWGTVQNNSQIRSTGGGNPDLRPEYGTNFTYGFVYSPGWAEGLDLTVDYWKANLNDVISTIGVTETMNRCLGLGIYGSPDPVFCDRVERDPTTGDLVTVDTTGFNFAEARLSGIDLGAAYRWDAGDWGNFRFSLDTSWTEKSEFRNNALSGFSDSTGFYNGSPNFEYRSVATIDWTKGDYSVRWTTRYMSSLQEDCSPDYLFVGTVNEGWYDNLLSAGGKNKCTVTITPLATPIGNRTEDRVGVNRTGAYAVHDLNVSWKAPWDATVSVGARNLFGKEPPILYNTFAHSFDASYDLPGGAYWYMSYRQDF